MGKLQDQSVHQGGCDVTVLCEGLPPDPGGLQPGGSRQSRQVLWRSTQLKPRRHQLRAAGDQSEEQAGHAGAPHGHSGGGVQAGAPQAGLQDHLPTARMCVGTFQGELNEFIDF